MNKKKFLAMLLTAAMALSVLAGCGQSSSAGSNGEVYVYNWGEYIDPETSQAIRA